MNMQLKVDMGNADNLSEQPNRRHTPLPTPGQLRADFPVPPSVQAQILEHRQAVRRVLNREDARTLIVVGPCSIHDESAALEYAAKLKALADDVSDRFLIVMRAYLEKPRTTVGWKGMLYDPDRTGQGDLNEGLIRCRRLLLNLAEFGLPLATEALSPFTMDYLGDLVSWTAIGARTTESQVHREMVSGLSMPVGFKNGTDGGVAVAVNAMRSAAHSHQHFGVGANGLPSMITTDGNPDTHLVLRGGRGLTNYDAESISHALDALSAGGVSRSVMVDCSHDNARKQAIRQIDIAKEVMAQKHGGNDSIVGLMLESFLEEGRQNDDGELVFGCSITDPCLSWTQTDTLIRSL